MWSKEKNILLIVILSKKEKFSEKNKDEILISSKAFPNFQRSKSYFFIQTDYQKGEFWTSL